VSRAEEMDEKQEDEYTHLERRVAIMLPKEYSPVKGLSTKKSEEEVTTNRSWRKRVLILLGRTIRQDKTLIIVTREKTETVEKV